MDALQTAAHIPDRTVSETFSEADRPLERPRTTPARLRTRALLAGAA